MLLIIIVKNLTKVIEFIKKDTRNSSDVFYQLCMLWILPILLIKKNSIMIDVYLDNAKQLLFMTTEVLR